MTVVTLAIQKLINQLGAFAATISRGEKLFGFVQCGDSSDDFKVGASKKDFITRDRVGPLVVGAQFGIDDVVDEPRVGHQNLMRKRALEFRECVVIGGKLFFTNA